MLLKIQAFIRWMKRTHILVCYHFQLELALVENMIKSADSSLRALSRAGERLIKDDNARRCADTFLSREFF